MEKKALTLILKPSAQMSGKPGYPSLEEQIQSRVARGYAASADRISRECSKVILTDGETKAWEAKIVSVSSLTPTKEGSKKRAEITFGKPRRIPMTKVPSLPRGSNNVRYG